MSLPRFTGKELTKHLRTLAMEAETLSDDGTLITKAEALARALWKKALGFTETVVRDKGPEEVIHTPEAWAIQLIYERLEGKVANAAVDDGGKISAAERVSELSRNRINAYAGATAPVKAPPKLPKKG